MKAQLLLQITAYLEGSLTLKELVTWAEEQVMRGFDADGVEAQIVYRLGVADAANFELTWEELASMLNRLGYKVQLHLQPA